MGVSVKTDLEWGQIFYLKNDPDQLQYRLVGLPLEPGSTNKKGEIGVVVKFKLRHLEDFVEVYDFEASPDKDIKKVYGDKDADENEEE